MGTMHDAIIIGAGHNALVAAFYLAKAGRRPLVLERQAQVGGGAITTEIHPGFRCPTLSHEILLDAQIVSDLDLRRHGVEFIALPALVCAVSPRRSCTGAARRCQRQRPGAAIVQHQRCGRVLDVPGHDRASRVRDRRDVQIHLRPTSISPSASDLWSLLKTGRRFRAIGKRDGYRLLRWLLDARRAISWREWFE